MNEALSFASARVTLTITSAGELSQLAAHLLQCNEARGGLAKCRARLDAVGRALSARRITTLAASLALVFLACLVF